MIAALLERLNAPLTVSDAVMCFPPDFGQVTVRVLASGICGAQLQEIAGHKGNARFIPHLLGHEGCGIVEDCGAGVTRVKPGDKVVMHWRKADGIESDFPSFSYGGRTIRSGRVTTFSEWTVCSENRVTPVPQDTPPELCSLLGCGLSTALATVEQEGRLRFGESVLIVGLGGLGISLVKAAKMANAWPVAACDIHPEKAGLAASLGLDTFWLGKIPENERFDVIIDTAGAGKSMENTLQNLAPGGRFVMVGQPKPGETVAIHDAKHLFEGQGKHILATQGGGFRPDLDIPRYLRLWRAGLLKVDDLITDRIPLREINHGLDMVRAGKAGRVLIDMSL